MVMPSRPPAAVVAPLTTQTRQRDGMLRVRASRGRPLASRGRRRHPMAGR
jgi:hypothetical protein